MLVTECHALVVRQAWCPGTASAGRRQSWPTRSGARLRAADREDALPYGSAGTRLPRGSAPAGRPHDQRRAIGSAGERLVHTEEVTGSIPVSPTDVRPGQRLHGQLSSHAEDGSCRRIGSHLGSLFSFLGPSLAPARNNATASYSGLRPGAARTCANRSSSSPRGSTDECSRAVPAGA